MKMAKSLFKFAVYYIVGFLSFIVISYTIHITLFKFLTNDIIIPQVEVQLFPYQLFSYFPWYIVTYTILYFFILYIIHRYDVYIANKLNEKLNIMKGEQRNEQE